MQPTEMWAAASGLALAAIGFATGHYSRRDARRLTSGSVKTTDADELWEQNSRFQETLLSRIGELEDLLRQAARANRDMEAENRQLRHQVSNLEAQVAALSSDVAALRALLAGSGAVA